MCSSPPGDTGLWLTAAPAERWAELPCSGAAIRSRGGAQVRAQHVLPTLLSHVKGGAAGVTVSRCPVCGLLSAGARGGRWGRGAALRSADFNQGTRLASQDLPMRKDGHRAAQLPAP